MDVNELNEEGRECLQSGDMDKARSLFFRALGPDTLILHRVPSEGSDCFQQRSKAYTIEGCDMGLNFHLFGIPFDGQASLYHNVGQTYVRTGQYSEAYFWMGIACEKLEPNLDKLTLLSVRINYGHTCARLKRNREALDVYHAALNDAEGRTQHVAALQHSIASLLLSCCCSNQASALDTVKTFLSQSLTLCQHLFGEQSGQSATVYFNFGRYFYALQDFKQALEFFQKALYIRRALLPCDSVDVVACLCCLGQTFHELKEDESSIQYYRDFLSHSELGNSCSAKDVSTISRFLVEIYIRHRAYQDALRTLDHVLKGRTIFTTEEFLLVLDVCFRVVTTTTGVDFPASFSETNATGGTPSYRDMSIERLANVAQLSVGEGDFHGSLSDLVSLYQRTREDYGPRSRQAARCLCEIAKVILTLKGDTHSLATYQEALSIDYEQRDRIEDMAIATILNLCGILQSHLGNYDSAIDFLNQSLQIRSDWFGLYDQYSSSTWFNPALAHIERGDEDIAMRLLQTALEFDLQHANCPSCDTVKTLQLLGLIHQRRGEFDDAQASFERALEETRRNATADSTIDSNAVARLWNLLGNIHLLKANVKEMMQCFIQSARLFGEDTSKDEALVITGFGFYSLAKILSGCAAAA